MADGSTSTLTNPVVNAIATNYLPKFTSSSAIGIILFMMMRKYRNKYNYPSKVVD
jgi:hypothetical protein